MSASSTYDFTAPTNTKGVVLDSTTITEEAFLSCIDSELTKVEGFTLRKVMVSNHNNWQLHLNVKRQYILSFHYLLILAMLCVPGAVGTSQRIE